MQEYLNLLPYQLMLYLSHFSILSSSGQMLPLLVRFASQFSEFLGPAARSYHFGASSPSPFNDMYPLTFKFAPSYQNLSYLCLVIGEPLCQSILKNFHDFNASLSPLVLLLYLWLNFLSPCLTCSFFFNIHLFIYLAAQGLSCGLRAAAHGVAKSRAGLND